ncbi:MAG: hypothetical protein ACPG8W_06760 [Candidatus Promineifilaceae bacterium]
MKRLSFVIGSVLMLAILALTPQIATRNVGAQGPGCVIPDSGPWPPCATGGGGGNTGGNTGGSTDCVIPPTGPWPPCATGGGGGGGGGNTGGNGGSTECVIPSSGPWPPCATSGGGGGGGGGGAAPAPGGSNNGSGCVIPTSGPWPPCATEGGGPAGNNNTNTPPAPTGPDDNNVVNVTTASGTTRINITSQPVVQGTKKFGINVGARDQYGAAQLLKNLVPNPGFEASEFGMVFIVLPGATNNRVQSDSWQTAWNNDAQAIGQPIGFWNGASYEIVSGTGKGRSGSVSSFTHASGRYTFNLSGGGATPSEGDIVFVRKNIGGYDFDTLPRAKANPGDKRPGSPGAQSLRLSSSGNGFTSSYREDFDSYGRDGDQTAGKLLQVRGNWVFEVWAKGTTANSTMRIDFRRIGGGIFMNETVDLTQGWQRIQRTFSVDANADAQIANLPQSLALQLFVAGGDVLVDDIKLQRADYNNPTVFSDTYVNALRELRPGVLRNWGAQLGGTLDNQLAGPYARKSTDFNPQNRIATNWHYSLHEFLRLSQVVGAEPWYVVPPTFSPADMQNLIAYLAAPAGSSPYAQMRANMGQAAPWTSVFGKIHLEYGNEVWGSAIGGDPFLGATMRGGINAAQVANDRFALAKNSRFFNASKFNLVIGGQERFTGRQTEIESNSTNHDSIGFAPYFGELTQWQNDTMRYQPLYTHASELGQRGRMLENERILEESGQGTEMVIYEINLDRVKNAGVPADVCNDFLTSQGAGIAVPLTMLAYLRDLGIRTQAAYTSAQYSTPFFRCVGQSQRIFGMLRDIEATGRKRPAWLGIELANKALGGNMVAVDIDGASYTQQPINGIEQATQANYVQAFAFNQGGRWSLVLFNTDLSQARNVTINGPSLSSGQMHSLTGNNLHSDNETNNNIAIQTASVPGLRNGHTMTLQPHSMVVLTWGR